MLLHEVLFLQQEACMGRETHPLYSNPFPMCPKRQQRQEGGDAIFVVGAIHESPGSGGSNPPSYGQHEPV